jgi:hypothetical protein
MPRSALGRSRNLRELSVRWRADSRVPLFKGVSNYKTCLKLGIGFWDYLGARLNVPGCQFIPPLPELILAKARSP